MGFGDLFKPAHRSSNAETRLKAIDRVDDDRILVDLASYDGSPRVRLAAVKRIRDEDSLLAVALEGEEIDARLAAVERIDSQQKLARIIRERKNYQLMSACFARLTDRSLLEKIANDTEYNMTARRMAIENFADESFLQEMEEEPTGRHAAKSPEEIAALIDKYGGVRLVRALGKFRGSPAAMKAMGYIIDRNGEAGLMAVEYLAQGLIHANTHVAEAAREELRKLRDGELIRHLIGMMDKSSLHGAILDVLKGINHPDARAMVEKTDR